MLKSCSDSQNASNQPDERNSARNNLVQLRLGTTFSFHEALTWTEAIEGSIVRCSHDLTAQNIKQRAANIAAMKTLAEQRPDKGLASGRTGAAADLYSLRTL